MTGLNVDRPSLLRWGSVGAASLILLASAGLPSFRSEAQPKNAVPVRIIGTLFVAVAGDAPARRVRISRCPTRRSSFSMDVGAGWRTA